MGDGAARGFADASELKAPRGSFCLNPAEPGFPEREARLGRIFFVRLGESFSQPAKSAAVPAPIFGAQAPAPCE